jgi:predicted RNA-binding Zn-ribbon protein involved in translation (DUF1610 family)
MEQIVGQTCVRCRNIIESIAEGAFCNRCGQAVHYGCMEANIVMSPYRCEHCGNPVDDVEIARQRVKQLQSIEVEREQQRSLRMTGGDGVSNHRHARPETMTVIVAVLLGILLIVSCWLSAGFLTGNGFIKMLSRW